MIDFVAGGFELAASYAIGDKKRIGFLLNFVGNAAWIYVALTMKVYGILLVVLPAMVLNIRNFLKMAKKRKIRKLSIALVSIGMMLVLFAVPVTGYVVLRQTQEQVEVITDPHSGVLVVETEAGQGSCFVVAKGGTYWYAITAAHVVEADYGSAMHVIVDELYPAEIVRVDPNEDVALIRFQSMGKRYMVYELAEVQLGESCTAVGYSRGSKLAYKGHVASLDYDGFIVANGGVVPGCSGGVLLNKDNRAIGITVALSVYRGWAFDSTALYVPARFARALLVAAGLE